jgi:molecular chaperone HscB
VNVETRTRDFFGFLGLARKLKIDAADLEQRYRALSRQCHPDYFYNAPPAERRASLERSSYLNDAYRTLKNPVSRLEYLLKLERPMERDGPTTPSHALLEEVFALNEELDAIREERESGAPEATWKSRLNRAREPIERKRAEHEAALDELSAKWDALVDASGGEPERRRALDELRERFLERNYITNLLAGIERELAE